MGDEKKQWGGSTHYDLAIALLAEAREIVRMRDVKREADNYIEELVKVYQELRDKIG